MRVFRIATVQASLWLFHWPFRRRHGASLGHRRWARSFAFPMFPAARHSRHSDFHDREDEPIMVKKRPPLEVVSLCMGLTFPLQERRYRAPKSQKNSAAIVPSPVTSYQTGHASAREAAEWWRRVRVKGNTSLQNRTLVIAHRRPWTLAPFAMPFLARCRPCYRDGGRCRWIACRP